MKRRTFLIGLASAAAASALPAVAAASHDIRGVARRLGWRGHINCRCTVHLLEGYKPAFTQGVAPHIAGCTLSRIASHGI